MKNNLIEIGKEYLKIRQDLLHNGYSGEFLEEMVVSTISETLLDSLGETENYYQVKRALMNMYFIGQTSNHLTNK